jgi:hypothetical protein
MVEMRPSQSRRRFLGTRWLFSAVGLVLMVGCLAAGSAPALASTKTLRVTYEVKVKRGVLARGRTVRATVKVSNPQPNVSFWWSRAAVATVVREGVENGYQKPYAVEGYRCKPVVHKTITRYTCRLRPADLATTATLTFAVRFRPGFGGIKSPPPSAQFDFPIVVKVTGLGANQTALVGFDNALINPYPSDLVYIPVLRMTGSGSVLLPRNAMTFVAGSTSASATVQTVVQITNGGSALVGIANVPAGAAISISINGNAPVRISNGNFSVPLH